MSGGSPCRASLGCRRNVPIPPFKACYAHPFVLCLVVGQLRAWASGLPVSYPASQLCWRENCNNGTAQSSSTLFGPCLVLLAVLRLSMALTVAYVQLPSVSRRVARPEIYGYVRLLQWIVQCHGVSAPSTIPFCGPLLAGVWCCYAFFADSVFCGLACVLQAIL
jgi:hypothetical protein